MRRRFSGFGISRKRFRRAKRFSKEFVSRGGARW
nr:hypothetical protein UMIGIWAJ_UMIGIWAJ_CDS_0005 [Microvirus sp.]